MPVFVMLYDLAKLYILIVLLCVSWAWGQNITADEKKPQPPPGPRILCETDEGEPGTCVHHTECARTRRNTIEGCLLPEQVCCPPQHVIPRRVVSLIECGWSPGAQVNDGSTAEIGKRSEYSSKSQSDYMGAGIIIHPQDVNPKQESPGRAVRARYAISGMVARITGCENAVPGTYVNVPQFYDWIGEKMAAEGFPASSYTYKS